MIKSRKLISIFISAAMLVTMLSAFTPVSFAEETESVVSVVADYKYDTPADARSGVTNTNRYIYDADTFKSIYGYGGTVYWDWDYDGDPSNIGNGTVTTSQKGKQIRINANSLDLTALQVGTYVETSFDAYYHFNENSRVIMGLSDASGNYMHQFEIRGNNDNYVVSRGTNKSKVSASEDALHRFKFTLQRAKNTDGNLTYNVVGLSVDGVEAASDYTHEIMDSSKIGSYVGIDFRIITVVEDSEGNLSAKWDTVPADTTDYNQLWVDNFSVVTYTSETGVSPVGDKAGLSKKLQQMSQLLLDDDVDSALKTKIEALLPDVVTTYHDADATVAQVTAAEASLEEIDTALENYSKLAEYEEKYAFIIDQTDVADAIETAKTAIVSGDADAIAEAFAALDELETRLPKNIANFTFDDATATRSASANTDRYMFDESTFSDVLGFDGAYYWDFDYDSTPADIGNGSVTTAQTGKMTTIKGNDLDFTALPIGTCVETSFDLKYHLHPQSKLIMSMNSKLSNGVVDFEKITIDQMGFTASPSTSFSVPANEDAMHRVRLVMQVQEGDTEGSRVYKIIGLSVDGNEAPSAYAHEVGTPANVQAYHSLGFMIVSNGKWHSVPTENTEDFTRIWIDNYSVVTYYSEDGEPLVGDKAELSRQLQQLSGIVNSDTVSDELKAEINEKAVDMLTVYHNPLATQTQVDAAAAADDLIVKAIKDEFESMVHQKFGFDEVTSDITEMQAGFTSTLTSTVFDVDYTTSNQDILDTDGTVTRPKINESITVTAVAAANVTGQTFTSQFEARVMAKGEETNLPATGELLAYADLETEEGTVTVTADGINAAVNVKAGTNEIQLYADTNKGKYAIFVNGSKVTQGEFEADSITGVAIGEANVNCIKPDSGLYETKGIKFKIGNSEREYTKLLSGARVASVELMDKNVFEEDAYLIVASYTGEAKELYSAKSLKLSDLTFDKKNKVEIELELPEDVTSTSISAFVFSSFDELVPLALKYDYAPDVATAVGATVYIAGDSTAQKYTWNETANSSYPQAGWGQMFDDYFLDGLNIVNAAISGSTLKTYYTSTDRTRSFNFIKDNILSGDYMLIQFGHNDYIRSNDSEETIADKRCTIDEFKSYLKIYVEMAQDAGATPILMTCTQRRSDAANSNNPQEEYRQAARDVAAELEIDCIDAGAIGVTLLSAIGKDGAGKYLYMYIEKDDIRYADDPRFTAKNVALDDNTHLNEYGADVYAMLFAREFLNLDSTQAIAAYVDEEKLLDDEALKNKILADYAEYLKLKDAAQTE